MSRPFLSPWMLFTHFADFRGRATRTGLVSVWIGVAILGLVAVLPANLFLDREGSQIVDFLVGLITLVPTMALFVRRLHDQGRSGWLALVATPVAGLNLFEGWERIIQPYYVAVRSTDLMMVTGISFGLTLLLFFLPEEKGANRYGANPREPEPDGPSLQESPRA